MSKLSGRAIKTTTYNLEDVEINLKPIPFGKVLKIQEEYKKVENQSELEQLKFITQILLEHTDLTEDDLGDNDYSLSVEEATKLFTAMIKANQDPKALGQGQR
jgi:hypothetical protein